MNRHVQSILLAVSFCIGACAQTNELQFSLGGFLGQTRTSVGGSLDLSPGVTLGINYGRRLIDGEKLALYGEINFLANAQRQVSSANITATRDIASLYVTPGLRLKFRPHAALSPFVAVGGGWARYEQSLTRLDGRANTAPREIDRGVVDYGGGVDVRVWRFLSLRGEVRDFYSGSPAYNVPSIRGGQHNVTAGGSFVIRW